jgi:Neuraminidase (sialidase)
MVKVQLNGAEYEYRFDLGALMRYEQLTTKLPKEQKTEMMSSLLMHYACLVSDATFAMSLTDFAAGIASKAALTALNEASAAEQARWEGLNAGLETERGASKKK